jgi:hypothetical protein
MDGVNGTPEVTPPEPGSQVTSETVSDAVSPVIDKEAAGRSVDAGRAATIKAIVQMPVKDFRSMLRKLPTEDRMALLGQMVEPEASARQLIAAAIGYQAYGSSSEARDGLWAILEVAQDDNVLSWVAHCLRRTAKNAQLSGDEIDAGLRSIVSRTDDPRVIRAVVVSYLNAPYQTAKTPNDMTPQQGFDGVMNAISATDDPEALTMAVRMVDYGDAPRQYEVARALLERSSHPSVIFTVCDLVKQMVDRAAPEKGADEFDAVDSARELARSLAERYGDREPLTSIASSYKQTGLRQASVDPVDRLTNALVGDSYDERLKARIELVCHPLRTTSTSHGDPSRYAELGRFADERFSDGYSSNWLVEIMRQARPRGEYLGQNPLADGHLRGYSKLLPKLIDLMDRRPEGKPHRYPDWRDQVSLDEDLVDVCLRAMNAKYESAMDGLHPNPNPPEEWSDAIEQGRVMTKNDRSVDVLTAVARVIPWPRRDLVRQGFQLFVKRNPPRNVAGYKTPENPARLRRWADADYKSLHTKAAQEVLDILDNAGRSAST